MGITSISRDWGANPSIVRIVTTDNLAAITTVGYLASQLDNIIALNAGPFQWANTDLVLISYDNDAEINFFVRSVLFDNFVILTPGGSLSDTLADGFIFVGNASDVASPVQMSGDVTIDNTGAASIAAGVIVNAMVDSGAAIAFSKLAALPSARILVGSAGNVATAVAMSGVIAITNAGFTSIVAGSIVNADINAAAAIAYSKLATLASGNVLVGSAGGVATSVVMSGDATIIASGALTIAANAVTTAKILDANVTLAKLAAGITPSHVIKFANQVTTVGGAAAEAFVVTGALAASDRAFVQVVDNGAANVTVLQAVITNDTLTVTFSADPSNDVVINYQIIRAAA